MLNSQFFCARTTPCYTKDPSWFFLFLFWEVRLHISLCVTCLRDSTQNSTAVKVRMWWRSSRCAEWATSMRRWVLTKPMVSGSSLQFADEFKFKMTNNVLSMNICCYVRIWLYCQIMSSNFVSLFYECYCKVSGLISCKFSFKFVIPSIRRSIVGLCKFLKYVKKKFVYLP